MVRHSIFGVALAAVAMVAAGGAARAQATGETPVCKLADDRAIPVVADSFIQSFAQARIRPGGDIEIAVNEERGGAGLGRQTKEWLFERQCILAGKAQDHVELAPNGQIDFMLIQQQEADCEAYQRIVEKYQGQRNALSVIDRDVSAQQRGSYWDPSMGQIRSVSADYCLGR